MIALEDIYEVLEAMVPLYVALMIGYASVRWWRMFTAEQCDGVNRMVCYFIIPLFGFEFTTDPDHPNLFKMNYSALAADAISKILAVLMLALCAKCSSRVDHIWWITTFSLLTLTDLVVVGTPMMRSMYGGVGVDLVVQSSAVQAILWFPLLSCFLECRKMGPRRAANDDPVANDQDVERTAEAAETNNTRPRLWTTVGLKLALNPHFCTGVVIIAWAVIAHRFKVKMPGIVRKSIEILSGARLGTSMFSMGMFMAMQEKVLACGMKITILGMVLRFVAGPALMTLSSLVVGLHSDVLRIAVIQAALPQSITTFIFAKEYGLHANLLSTAVVFGTLASLPLLIAYYAALEVI